MPTPLLATAQFELTATPRWAFVPLKYWDSFAAPRPADHLLARQPTLSIFLTFERDLWRASMMLIIRRTELPSLRISATGGKSLCRVYWLHRFRMSS